MASGLFTACAIRPEVLGSDHCPVVATLRCDVSKGAAGFVPLPSAVSSLFGCVFCQSVGPSAAGRLPPTMCAEYLPAFSAKQQKLSSFFGAGAAVRSSAASPPVEGPVASSGAGAGSGSGSGQGLAAGTPVALSSQPLTADDIDAFLEVPAAVRVASPSPGFLRSESSGGAGSSSGPASTGKRKQPSAPKSQSLKSYFQQREGVSAKKPKLDPGAGAGSASVTNGDAAARTSTEAEDLALALRLSAEEAGVDASATAAQSESKQLPAQSAAEADSARQQWSSLLNQRAAVVLCKGHK